MCLRLCNRSEVIFEILQSARIRQKLCLGFCNWSEVMFGILQSVRSYVCDFATGQKLYLGFCSRAEVVFRILKSARSHVWDFAIGRNRSEIMFGTLQSVGIDQSTDLLELHQGLIR
ncbi:hypothetical protein HNY73_000224 [Argiope bruennichi]|uniref:Uncharacterized protein n=1 Tax=Argiope bruennichi TaxID=94029 RepID=A0A8T0FYE3_ARGBR|nr:hypothetical protein HNY73_000224 [Argiope bruennichi]